MLGRLLQSVDCVNLRVERMYSVWVAIQLKSVYDCILTNVRRL